MVEIDKYAGFCFGVTKAIKSAEDELTHYGTAYCLGKIVHNQVEENRLHNLGLKTIDSDEMQKNPPARMLIRAHGEPPETYITAEKLGISIVDETCPVVLKLQRQIAETYNNNPDWGIVIFGKKGHAEVNGLVGQTNGKAVVISSLDEINDLDFSKKIALFSQTTADYTQFEMLEKAIRQKTENLEVHETICGSVKNRIPLLREFCANYDMIIFVSDVASSNGKMLYDVCKEANKNSYFVTNDEDLRKDWFSGVKTIGVSGANSTPQWLLEKVKEKCCKIIN